MMTQTKDEESDRDEKEIPPGAPDRTPVKEPDDQPSIGDPQPKDKKKPRL